MSELDGLASQPPPVPPPIGEALERELAAVKPVATRHPLRQLAVLVGVSLVYGAGLVWILTMRDDMHELPMGWLAAVAVAWLFGFLVPSYLALTPVRGGMLPRWRPAAITGALAAVVFVTLGLVMPRSGPSSEHYGTEHFARGHTCLEVGLLSAMVPVVLGALFLRGALPIGSRWIAAALGAAGGCLGGLVLHFHCDVADGLHVGVVHGGVVVVSALLSAAIVPRATEVR